jgi:hypothetical protein
MLNRQALILALAFVVSSCASAQTRHTATVGNVAVYQALSAIQDTADTLRQTGVITPAQRQDIAAHLLPALKAGQQLERVTAAWSVGKPAPTEITTVADQLKALITDVIAQWPDSPGKSAIAQKLSIAEAAVLALVLAVAR